MGIYSDFHSHVARSSALHMAQAAQERGLRVLGLSEHIFQMQEARPTLAHMPLEGPLCTFSDYVQAVHQAGQTTGLEVCLGLEVDFIPDKNEQIQSFLPEYPWDFLIGSVHEVDGMQFEKSVIRDRAEGEARWLRYFALLRAAVKSDYFSVISHPVRMRSQNPFLPPNFDEELDHLAAEAFRHSIALEINGHDVLHYPDLVMRLARACQQNNTPISVGSDAHRPTRVAQAHELTQELLHKVGIAQVRYWRERKPVEYDIED